MKIKGKNGLSAGKGLGNGFRWVAISAWVLPVLQAYLVEVNPQRYLFEGQVENEPLSELAKLGGKAPGAGNMKIWRFSPLHLEDGHHSLGSWSPLPSRSKV